MEFKSQKGVTGEFQKLTGGGLGVPNPGPRKESIPEKVGTVKFQGIEKPPNLARTMTDPFHGDIGVRLVAGMQDLAQLREGHAKALKAILRTEQKRVSPRVAQLVEDAIKKLSMENPLVRDIFTPIEQVPHEGAHCRMHRMVTASLDRFLAAESMAAHPVEFPFQ